VLCGVNTPDFTESKSCSVYFTVQPDVLKSCSVNKALLVITSAYRQKAKKHGLDLHRIPEMRG